MQKQIYLYRQVSRQLKATAMQKNGYAAIASARAEKIIKALMKGTPLSNAGLLRPRTDRRLRSSLKFNLGNGFRLICSKEKDVIHVLFLGDHDSCDTWLTQHGRKMPYENSQNVVVSKTIVPVCAPQNLSDDNHYSAWDNDLPEISQKNLRRVFKGLVGC